MTGLMKISFGITVEIMVQESMISLKIAHQTDDLGEYFGAGLYEQEIIFMIENEWAQSCEDILWRRSKKGFMMSKKEVTRLQQWLAVNQQ